MGSGVLLAALSFLAVIGPLIFLHELGHYAAGRAFGVHAETFSIGFGREVFGWSDRRGTRWKVGWMPMGGYVKFAGDMNPASQPTDEWLSLPPEERARTFQAKPVWQRFIIVAAGPIANFLVAIAIVAGLLLSYGELRTPPVIEALTEVSVARQAGLQPGDRFTRIAGRSVDTFGDVVEMVRLRPGEALSVDYERAGQARHTIVTPATIEEVDRFGNRYRMGAIGVMSAPQVVVPVSVVNVLPRATAQTFSMLRSMVDTIVQIITGRRSVQELGGPLKIAQISGQQASLGLVNVIMLMAMISINLGFINLLPIPMLDGGHLIFYVFEAIRRRPLPAIAQEWAFRSGLLVLLGFMLFVTFNDLGSFGLWQRLAGLIG
ncbi:RIP metalloprotease RseP [Sphingomonas naphthae]|uniref:Zinc metalloprotease n=1 Tax=Sphingomonas naphthae TaxID=1813468 RepID=A0ABY7TR06_9SPHN|nr:RIP metalloprotease RseP [Sphingomonas naphthae]WCT75072.1 RIP metalloprotease RseP [Sphingomonas naphthae]